MKIVHANLKAGVVKVLIENLDDLWYLSSVVCEGDLVKTKTERRLKAKEDIGRAKKAERVTFTLGVRVEKADFKSDSDTYRITGRIEEGPEDLVSIGSHHTFNVEKGTQLAIIKERWSGASFGRLKEAEKASLRPKILIAAVDEGDATFGLVRESKIEYFELSKVIGGKYDQTGRKQRKEEFYADTAKFMREILGRENISAVIVAGAGFEKEHFLDYLREKYSELAGKAVLEHIGSYGRNGVQEVLKREGVQRVIEEIESARDEKLVSEILREIGKDSGLGAYGLKDVEDAVFRGAAQKLLVCDDVFLKDRQKIEQLLSAVKGMQGEAHIVNREGDAGKQLTAIGGIAALLRYAV